MGQGIELARVDNPEHAEAIDNMKDQLLIVLLKMLGGQVTIPVSVIDGTSGESLAMGVDIASKKFTFSIVKKH